MINTITHTRQSKRSGGIAMLQALDKFLFSVENAAGIIALTIMIIAVLTGIVMRFVLKIPNMWGEEISRYMMVWAVYLGIGCGCRTRTHLAVEGFVNSLPRTPQRVMRFSTRLTIVGTYGFLMWITLKFVFSQFSMGQISPGMQIPNWIVYLGLVIGFLFAFLTEIILFINDFLVDEPFLTETRMRGAE